MKNKKKKSLEDMNTEYKLALNSDNDKIEKWAKTLVGFANTDGGKLYVGINDDGAEIGMSRKDVDLTKKLVLLTIERHIYPHIKVKMISKSIKKEKYILIVNVDQNDALIVYKNGDYNENVYIRENGSTVKASVSQIIQLGKRKTGYDSMLIGKKFNKKDFSDYYKLIKKYRKDKYLPNEEYLISKSVVKQNLDVMLGLNMFSNSYDNELSLVCCRLWNGFDRGVDEVLDKEEYKGSLGFVFQEAMSFIIRNSRKGYIKLKNGSRKNTASYPEIAIREALINALAHRDYSIDGTQIDIDIYKNRLEIRSPGSWLLSSSPASYPIDRIPSIRRNKVICNCFEIAGLMEKSGSGFKKIHNIYKNVDIEQPVLESNNDSFTIVLFDLLFNSKLDVVNNINIRKYDNKILEYCLDAPKSREDIQKHISYKSRQHFTADILKPLLNEGLLFMTEQKKSKMQKYKTNKELYKNISK